MELLNQQHASNSEIRYCLYARKSSESDERQTMSIDSQVKEMSALAIKDDLAVKEIRQESHSAKISGQRPVFRQLLADIDEGKFSGILTWAPDRLSRNAGDLGMLVDLMDQGKLQQIKTFSQTFSNNPNEKFLLMILCSQAKLENDQKGLNVKRGIRAKCEMGWRPGMSPIGYYNRSFNGIKDIIPDPDRASVVTEMFERVAGNGDSGRAIKRWMDGIKFTTRAGKNVTLSQIYLMLKNPFYYGEFEYPTGSGNWYKGQHKPLITKEIFERVQKQLTVPPKSKWGGKKFDFKDLFKCACCGASVIGEEKYRKRKNGTMRHHIYYHCTRQINYNCPEPYVTEEELIKALLRYINFMEMAHPQTFKTSERLKRSILDYREIRDTILLQQDVDPDSRPMTFTEYARHALKNGTTQEKREVVLALDRQLYLHDKGMVSSLIK
jgi:site-specific DNA recombinase